ncbi:DENN domain-containing protein 10-like [Rhodnius prolixus]|uniref:UDENN domain-containing protein n=1 Tax=Rhodnius prolixus TaxID=13249 RepID=T1HS59_RHOPR
MSDLISCNIIEKDKNGGDYLWSWTFPYILQEQKDFIEKKCILQEIKNYIYGRWKKKWFYINVIECDSEKMQENSLIGVVIWTKEFNPDKYRTLASLLCRTYHESGDPTKVLQLYLSVFTKEIDSNENGSLLFKEYCSYNAFNHSNVKEMINMFGLEIILIYNALLLKRKLVVYHHNLSTLLEWLKSFPYIMLHRKFDDVFFPWIELTDEEIQELTSCSNYIAGCCDNSVFSRPELYDVLVNLPAKEITVPQQSKDRLPMTKVHKEIALYMEQLGKSDSNEEKVVKAISEKTEEIILRLKSFARLEDGNLKLSLTTLKQNDISPAMENFLIQLASSESIQTIVI